jgi:hypothetical protein
LLNAFLRDARREALGGTLALQIEFPEGVKRVAVK